MAEKEIKKPETEQIKFLGQEATKLVKSDGTVSVTMNKDGYTSLLEKENITKEVVNTVTAGLQKIQKDAIIATKDLCKKCKGANVVVKLGSGNLSQDIKFIGRKEFHGHNPTNGKPIDTVKHGVVEATLHLPFGKELKGDDGLLAKIADEMKDFFDKKK